jgi:zinc transporter
VRQGETMRSPVDLLVHLLHDQADVLVQIARDATIKVDNVEDDLLSHRLEAKRSELGAMRRVLVRLRRVLAPEPSALFRLLHRPPAWAKDEDVRDMSAATEEFSRVLSDMDSLVERIRLLQEEVAAEVNERTSGSLYLLTIVTVLALPINIIAGLFGMNVGGVPLATHTHGFWIVIAVIASFTLVAASWALRKRG